MAKSNIGPIEPRDITPEDSVAPVWLIPITPEEEIEGEKWVLGQADRERKEIEQQRLYAYQTQADPLFFGFQRGDNTEQAWLDAVQAVKDANPYPVLEDN